MQEENSSAQAMAEIIRTQEKALQFDNFTADDAWTIGMSLREHAMARGGNVSIDITLNRLALFHSVAGQPTPNNDRWVNRKRNTVLEFWKSSLLVAQEMILSGRKYQTILRRHPRYARARAMFPSSILDHPSRQMHTICTYMQLIQSTSL